jgi:hypothetical protein
MIFCKIKKPCRAGPALRAEATALAPHDARVGLAQALLNGSCLRSARQTQSIWPSIPPHDNDGPRLSCHHIVRHSTSFLSPSCLLPVFVRHQPRHRLAQWLLHVQEDVSHHVRTIFFAVVGHPVHLPALHLVLPPQPIAPPTVATASRPTLVDTGTAQSPFSD